MVLFCLIFMEMLFPRVSKAVQMQKEIKMKLTAYCFTSLTASDTKTADGIVANNLLPFGTKVKIPSIFGNKIFTVRDRMNKRKGNYYMDIWYSSCTKAKKFGAKSASVQIIKK